MKRLLLAFCLFATPSQAREVTATVYDSWFHGRTTYCGQTFEYWGISAAHPWMECGTKLKITHKGKTLVVPITDRCNCNSVDLSAGAAHRLGVPLDGIARVKIH